MQRITDNQHVLLQLLRAALFHSEITLPATVDWTAVFHEAQQQAVLPLAYQTAKSLRSEAADEALDRLTDEIMVNNILMDFDHVELHGCMEAEAIPYVVMKGSASAAYYPQPALRMMGDVDFLVHPEDVERAGLALQKLGFQKKEEDDNPIHLAYHRQTETGHASNWELHWRPNGIPGGESGEKIRDMLADSIETGMLRETENGAYMVPDAFHHGLMLLIHTAMHLIHSGVGLRHLCDWAVFAASFDEERFRALFEDKLRSVGLWDFAAALTAVSVRFLGCPDPGWTCSQPEGLSEALLCDILDGGNFGKKNRERLNQAKLIVDRGEGTVRRAPGLRNLFSALNLKTRRSLPAVNDHPILMPAGWVYVGVRHLVRVLRGKRPELHLGRMIEGAEARSALYRQLRLFADADEE